jgi:shikimate dehydrogenase
MQSKFFQLGLIGFPLGHTFSPLIHTAAFKTCGLHGNYSLYPIPPGDTQGLSDLLERVRAKEIHGLNITIPHKQDVIPLIDELTPTAESIGAVNTIYMRGNKLVGANTDADGFLTDLKLTTGVPTYDQRPSALILGSGGAARAVIYALSNDGWNITVSARSIGGLQEFVRRFKNIDLIDFNARASNHSTYNLIVNTTPLGMVPNDDQSPWPEMPFPIGAVIYDLVYNPRITKLVKDARTQGLSAVTGMGMLIEQAALAFEIWTGHNPSRPVLFEAVNQ